MFVCVFVCVCVCVFVFVRSCAHSICDRISQLQNIYIYIYTHNPDICWPGPSAEMCRWRLLPGGFSWRIFWGTFSKEKTWRKNRARKSAEKSGGPNLKVREKSVLPKTSPNTWRKKEKIHQTLKDLEENWRNIGKKMDFLFLCPFSPIFQISGLFSSL